MSQRPHPELVVDGYPSRRPRWVELATSADHKDLGRILVTGSLGFLVLAALQLLLMRLQLAIPENSFLSPVTFNRLLSSYGTTAVFLFALPLAFGFLYYVAPLQIGARGTALPRVGQTGVALWVAGAAVLYATFLFTPSEAGINPLAPLTEAAYTADNGVNAWITGTGLATLGLVLLAIDLATTVRNLRAPGMAWRRLPVFSWVAAVASWLMLFIGPVLLAALTMLMLDRNYDAFFFTDGGGGAPLLWQHLSWIFFAGAYMLVVIFAFGAIAEVFSTFAGRPLPSRAVTMASLAAIAVIGTLAWMQNMLTSPIGIGWMYFAMLMSLALVVPVGLVFYNLIGTVSGGVGPSRAPLLYAAGAVFALSVGLAAELSHSLVGAAWNLKGTTDSTAATHFALGGGALLGGLAALHYWFPKMTGRTMGEAMARISFWAILVGLVVTFAPLFVTGAGEGQVIDAYKYYAGEGMSGWNLVSTIGSLLLLLGIVLALLNAIFSRTGGPRAGHDPWGGETLEWLALSPPDPHNFDVLPDVRSARPLRDIRAAVAKREGRAEPAGESRPVG